MFGLLTGTLLALDNLATADPALVTSFWIPAIHVGCGSVSAKHATILGEGSFCCGTLGLEWPLSGTRLAPHYYNTQQRPDFMAPF